MLNGDHINSLHPAYRTVGQIESCEFPLKKNLPYLVNPGSVGQPRDGDWRAGFAVYDSEARVVELLPRPLQSKNRAGSYPRRRPATAFGHPAGGRKMIRHMT